MATMNFSIPDDVKDRFNEMFKDANKSAVATRALVREMDDEQRRRDNGNFVARLREIRSRSRVVTEEEIRVAREELRR